MADNPIRALDAAVDRLWPEHLALLAELVRQPSLLGQERPAQEVLYRYLRRQGLPAELWDLELLTLAHHPAFAPAGLSYAGRPNLTARLAGRGGGRSLVLNGHIDVVSPEPVDRWSYGPWDATVSGGRMYGRGVSDMKAGLVAALLALQAVREAAPPLRGTVIFESVIEEECGGNGTLAARLRSGPVDGAIIPEPSGLRGWALTPGALWWEVTVVGRPGYVGEGARYVNAIDKACDLAIWLRGLAEAVNRDFHHPLYAGIERPLTANVGKLHAGDWTSNVALEATLSCRMSFPPDWPVERAQQLVEEHIGRFATADTWLRDHPPAIRYHGFRALGWEADPEWPLVKLLGACYQATTGEQLALAPMFGTADARYFDRGEQVIHFGPTGSGLHVPDEWVDLESVLVTARTLSKFIVEWCG